MATTEKPTGKNSPICEAESVLRHVQEFTEQKLLTREWAITAGEIERHLRALRGLISKEATVRNAAKYAWHASQIESMCAEYWRRRGQHT